MGLDQMDGWGGIRGDGMGWNGMGGNGVECDSVR